MIDLYFWPTPNGHKITIALEEMGLEYRLKPINIGKGDQFKPKFLAISPNNRMPAIIDHEGVDGKPQALFESGAILLYLAEKTGKFMASDGRQRLVVLEWLMWQMGGVGPMLGQAHHFIKYAKHKLPYAIQRYSNEANRLYGVLNRRLADRQYVADDYSIADMAIYPWTRTYSDQNVRLDDYPHVARWRKDMGGRPAVQKGMMAGSILRGDLAKMSEEDWGRLFGVEKLG
ncbi:MAG: glutathione S-transferase N-terminal domain-containing protein [Proteobacteria bacterium]|nr:glutathione S-transferase N-terminal domain-containing protein [Pseudomonadota bacterium]